MLLCHTALIGPIIDVVPVISCLGATTQRANSPTDCGACSGTSAATDDSS